MENTVKSEDSVAQLIWDGKLVSGDSHLEELRSRFLSRLSISEDPDSIEERMKCCKNPVERIQFIQNYFEWVDIPSHLKQRLGKSLSLSTSFRERANVEYKAGKLVGALRGYNLAVTFGRPGEEELSLAYANRSALLLHVREAKLALRDIHLALINKFPEELRPKLKDREKKCLAAIEREKESTTVGGKDDEEGQRRNFCERNLFTLKSPHDSIPGAEDTINIVCTPTRGRCVTVTKEVKAGSVLMVEKPYVTVLEKQLQWDVEHCHNCLRPLLGGIPCDKCTFVMYCNDECRRIAEAFHQYEHNLLSYMHGIDASRRDLMATRIMEILGPATVYELCGRWDGQTLESGSQSGRVPGFNHDGVYDSRTYEPIYHLVGHRDAHELCDDVSHSFKALLLTHLLKHESTFFQNFQASDDVTEEKFLVFTAALILRHLESIPFNAISLSELRSERKDTIQRSNFTSGAARDARQENSIKSVCYASAIFSLLAMCNHSCNPNAVHVRKAGGEVTALVTLRSLRPGEEVFITYGPLFTVHPVEERRKTLKEKYHFDCVCDPCAHNWALNDSLHDNMKRNILEKLNENESELKEIHKLICNGQEVVAMDRLLSCLEYFGSNYRPTFTLVQVAQDLFKKALIQVVNNQKMS